MNASYSVNRTDEELLYDPWYACMDENSKDGWSYPYVAVGGEINSNRDGKFMYPYKGDMLFSGHEHEDEDCYQIVFTVIPEPEPGTCYKLTNEEKVNVLNRLRGYLAL